MDPDVEFTKDFKAAIINMLKELKEVMITMTQQIGNINEEIVTIKKNQ